jgi:hypothetical protein
MSYFPAACDHCLRALEKAEENAQRLTGKPSQILPHPELCSVRKDLHQNCPHCQVSTPGECIGKEAAQGGFSSVFTGETTEQNWFVPQGSWCSMTVQGPSHCSAFSLLPVSIV